MDQLHPEALTWTALLGKWMDFAKASLALPDDAEGDRWRASVTAVINLQAVTFALADLAQLPQGQRPFGRDRAEVMIRDNAGQLEQIWRGEPMPDELLEIGHDAHRALERSIFAGATELIWAGDEPLVMPAVPVDGEDGTLAVMQPGTIVMPGEPVAWWVERDGALIIEALDGCAQREPLVPHQVYRQIDESGHITGDLVAPMDAELPAGMPLLVPLYERGRRIGHFTVDAETWLEQQRAAMTGSTIPVHTVES
jgi:hypothetical protein